MYIYICIYTRVQTYTSMHIYIYIYIRVQTYCSLTHFLSINTYPWCGHTICALHYMRITHCMPASYIYSVMRILYARITNTCTNIYINAYIHIHVYSLRDGLLADALPLNRYISVMRAYTYACKHMYKCLHNCIYTHVCIYTSRRTSRWCTSSSQ